VSESTLIVIAAIILTGAMVYLGCELAMKRR
jgi:hypothetical protein